MISIVDSACRMIESGDIFAEIDDQQGMVRFLEDAHSSDSPALMETLDSQIAQSIKLAERVRQLNFEASSLLVMRTLGMLPTSSIPSTSKF